MKMNLQIMKTSNTKKGEMSAVAAGMIVTLAIIVIALVIFFSKAKNFKDALGF